MLEITLKLRNYGYKVTPQRVAIFEALAAENAHPSAEMLFQRLRPQYPTMSLATIYKTLEMLKRVGLISVINLGEESLRYEVNGGTHPHLICTQCHSVEDAVWAADTNHERWLWDKFSFTLHKQQIFFYGICKACNAIE